MRSALLGVSVLTLLSGCGWFDGDTRLRAPRDGRWPDSDHQSLTDPPERGSAIRNLADAATNCYEIDRIRSVTTAPKAF